MFEISSLNTPFGEFEQAFIEIERRNEELKRKLSQALEMIDDDVAVEASCAVYKLHGGKL